MNALVKSPLTWTDVGAVTDVPLRGARRVPTPAGVIAVFRTGDGEVFALMDACPHKGGPLSQGIVFGDHVACPLHNWAISLVDGEARAPDVGCATRFTVRVDDGVVSLLAGELAMLAVEDGALADVGPATSRRVTTAPSSCAQPQDPRVGKTVSIPIVNA